VEEETPRVSTGSTNGVRGAATGRSLRDGR
jgi:hypothetical protein